MENSISSWKTIVRVAVVVGFIGGAVVAGEGCDCNGTGPYIGSNGELNCGDCSQYAFRCTDGTLDWAICAPDGPSASMHCVWWTESKDCAPSGGETGGDDGADDGGSSSGGGEPYDCGDWDPDAAVSYSSTTQRYTIDGDFVEDLKLNPLPLTECDCTKAKMVSGGYYQLYHMCQGDLADHLGFEALDMIKNVNGHDLVLPEDYLDAFDDLKGETEFEVEVVRQGNTITLEYQVR